MSDEKENKIQAIPRPDNLKRGLKIASLIAAILAGGAIGLEAEGVIKLSPGVSKILKVLVELEKQPLPVE